MKGTTKKENIMFLQKCGLRRYTKRSIDTLRKIGYETDALLEEPCLMTLCIRQPQPMAVSCYDDKLTMEKDAIDCKGNEDLFLALAALNDETDYMQWFVSSGQLPEWIRHDEKDRKFKDCAGYYRNLAGVADIAKFHKASVSELVVHFGGTQDK